jgi:CheY-like chemotaxis protein
MKILAVDDDSVFLDLLKVMLNSIGYNDLTVASSAEIGVNSAIVEVIPFECILCDIQMPVVDGIEFCRQIRAVPGYESTPILMITSVSEKSYVDAAFAAGATDYVSKPLEKHELKARLGAVSVMLTQTWKSLCLASQIKSLERNTGPKFDFDRMITLEEVDGLISYVALENYIMKIGRMRIFGYSTVAFSVSNAELLYATLAHQDFLDLMADVADIIWVTLVGRREFFAYAGSGNFVAVVTKKRGIEKDQLEDEIAQNMEEVMRIWMELGVQIPKVRVGNPVSYNPVSVEPLSYALTGALENLYEKPRPSEKDSMFGKAG